MFNQLLKWTLVISIWRKYKKHIGITIMLILALMLTSFIHQDFVNYSLASNNTSLGLSYVIKWLVYLVLVTGYWFMVSKVSVDVDKNSDLHDKMKASKNRAQQPTTLHDDKNEGEQSVDPFANIRNKGTLRSKADITIDQANK